MRLQTRGRAAVLAACAGLAGCQTLPERIRIEIDERTVEVETRPAGEPDQERDERGR